MRPDGGIGPYRLYFLFLWKRGLATFLSKKLPVPFFLYCQTLTFLLSLNILGSSPKKLQNNIRNIY